MPHKIKKYELLITDEPASYGDFDGGINTNPSNEHLEKNELRDCLNMHYQQGSLVKRNGAKLLSTLSSEIDLFKIQGVSLFTYKLTYIVIAANGQLYYGIYSPNSTINLRKLEIKIKVKTKIIFFLIGNNSIKTSYKKIKNGTKGANQTLLHFQKHGQDFF
jgi:hypothetical protein